MRYYRHREAGEDRLLVDTGDRLVDLTAVHGDLRSLRPLLSAASVTGQSLDEVAGSLAETAESVTVDDLERAARRPVVPAEVWAAGVTYEISEQAREDESQLPEVYRDVYRNERPEIFFKATPSRTVGPGDAVGVREDSDWDVPEPELAVVIYGGEIVGYTVGNDVSSRAIEGANPLYLPQAKVYHRSCSLGPAVVSPETVGDPHDLDISMAIDRDGAVVFEGTTSTAEMVRTCEELVSYYRRSNVLPDLAVLLTGTSLVPPEEVTLRPGDEVAIEIESIGTLHNSVVTV